MIGVVTAVLGFGCDHLRKDPGILLVGLCCQPSSTHTLVNQISGLAVCQRVRGADLLGAGGALQSLQAQSFWRIE